MMGTAANAKLSTVASGQPDKPNLLIQVSEVAGKLNEKMMTS